jgi:hypothetical protein
MSALIRYQLSLLLRSHRWIPAAVVYVVGVAGLGGVGGAATGHGSALAQGLSWSALMLVPAVAWLRRSALTAEPPAARAVVAAAGGPRRAQLAALSAALGFAAVFGMLGVGWEVISCGVVRSKLTNSVLLGSTVREIAAGLGTMVICLLVGSAIGAVCNPPVVRRPAASMLTSTAAVVLALVWSVSPANAAVRSGYGGTASSWPAGLPVIAAFALLAVTWGISALVAARRGG